MRVIYGIRNKLRNQDATSDYVWVYDITTFPILVWAQGPGAREILTINNEAELRDWALEWYNSYAISDLAMEQAELWTILKANNKVLVQDPVEMGIHAALTYEPTNPFAVDHPSHQTWERSYDLQRQLMNEQAENQNLRETIKNLETHEKPEPETLSQSPLVRKEMVIWTYFTHDFTIGSRPTGCKVKIEGLSFESNGVQFYVVKTPSGRAAVVEATTGAIVGNSIIDVMTDVSMTKPEVMKKQIMTSRAQVAKIEVIDAERFWQMYEHSTIGDPDPESPQLESFDKEMVIWTYFKHAFAMGGNGNKPTGCRVKTEGVLYGTTSNIQVYAIRTLSGRTVVVEATTGAIVGNDLVTVLADMSKADPEVMEEQIAAARAQAAGVEVIDAEYFWQVYERGMTSQSESPDKEIMIWTYFKDAFTISGDGNKAIGCRIKVNDSDSFLKNGVMIYHTQTPSGKAVYVEATSGVIISTNITDIIREVEEADTRIVEEQIAAARARVAGVEVIDADRFWQVYERTLLACM